MITIPLPATKTSDEIREDLIACREIALLDVREETAHAEGHPLFAANLPLSRIEIEAYTRIPRRNTPIVLLDGGEGLAQRAAARLIGLGYTDVKLLEGGLQGWRNSGGELFRDVNAPSKAFGELVQEQRKTPSLSAQAVQSLIDLGANMVILDVRRFDEFQTMSIPTAISCPGAELLLRVREIAPNRNTPVIVNCAGRTRSIIGAQSLINAGIPNPVAALRNGTIGWTLAKQALQHGQEDKFREVGEPNRAEAASAARAVADRAGVARIDLQTVSDWIGRSDLTVYRFDVRSPEEFENGHLPGFRNAPGGQLVQETDVYAPVRGARIVLVDDDGSRANMTASWLAQMNWKVFVLDGVAASALVERGPWQMPVPQLPNISEDFLVSPRRLNELLSQEQETKTALLDLAPSMHYAKCHIPGAWFVSRSQLDDALKLIDPAERYVLTSPDGLLAQFAWPELSGLTTQPVFVLEGGTDAWIAAGLASETSSSRYASEPIDRYRRPYEGTDVEDSAMQAYLDWEYGLVEQLRRDGTHGFFVI
jgi:rhodanese-related sulfurtransferase